MFWKQVIIKKEAIIEDWKTMTILVKRWISDNLYYTIKRELIKHCEGLCKR